MASAFASLFKSRKKGSNKENETTTANLDRGKPTSSSMRQQRAGKPEGSKSCPINGGVYLGDFDMLAQDEGSSFEEQTQQQQRGKASSVISGASPWTKSKWFQSPYDIITAPKTKKSSRSCPGGASHPPVPASVASLRHSRHHSPPSSYGSTRLSTTHTHQQQYPTIHEVSGCYENYAPMSTESQVDDLESMQRQCYKNSSSSRSALAQSCRSSGQGSRGRSSLIGIGYTVDSSSYNPLRQRIFGGNNHSRANSESKYRHPTSEYGSADPSPTNQFPPIPSVSSTSDIHTVNGEGKFENTDYDSDSDAMPADLVQLCTQQLRKVNGKCKTYKETAQRYKSKNLRLHAELQMVNQQLAKEKGKSQSLSSQLSEAKKEMHRLHSCLIRISENVPPPHHLSSRGSHLQPLQPINYLISGAGEALCSRTDSNSDLLMPLNKLGEQDSRKHYQKQQPIHSLFSQFNRKHEEEPDELITFRRNDFLESDCNEDFDSTEDPRNSKCSAILDVLNSSACKLSPPPPAKHHRIEEEDGPYAVVKEDDGYSTMLYNQEKIDEKGRQQVQAENASMGNSQSSANDLPQEACEEQKDSNGEENCQNRPKQTPPASPIAHPSPQFDDQLGSSPLRKSFSETDLSRICVEEEHDPQELANKELCNGWDEEEQPPANKVVKIVRQGPHRHDKQVYGSSSSFRNSRKQKYCCYSPNKGDYSSSYSSDDDAIRVLAKQLRKRGQLVQFKPTQRKSLTVGSCHEKLFRHFGQQERQAIAQFEYLKEMPTDVSGLLSSSPDPQSPS